MMRATITMSENAAHCTTDELETALRSNGFQVPDGALQELLDRKEWIYPTKSIAELRVKLSPIQLYSTFNSDHHIQSATKLFDFLKSMRKKVSVVVGQKAQGKSQFLFFVFKLLQAMGEKAIFLDRTAFPLKEDNLVHVGSARFCGHLWKESLLELDGQVKDALEDLYRHKRLDLFGKFLKALRVHSETHGTRVWVVIDDVILFDKFPISLPEEQEFSPFHWIVTGSAGIGSWVAKRHLERVVWDLPHFNKEQCLDVSIKLCNFLGVDLEGGIDGVPFNGVDDWLEERFGGVIGNIAEMFLALSKGGSVSQYMSTLSSRVNSLISNAAGGALQVKQLSQAWLHQLKSNEIDWHSLHDAGLCGRESPRGIIFTLILEWLSCYVPEEEDMLSLVRRFRSRFSTDPGLEGCLLKLEVILNLKASGSIGASLLTSVDQGWVIKESMDLPPKATPLNVFWYHERSSVLVPTTSDSAASWCLIEIPSGFDVIDVALVNLSDASSPAIYRIQITRSMNPFANKHHTFDTCPARSKERLEKLWSVITDSFQLDVANVAKFFVMLAPNYYCQGDDEFQPPDGHTSDVFLSAAKMTHNNTAEGYGPLSSSSLNSRKKRSRSHPVPTTTRSLRSKMQNK